MRRTTLAVAVMTLATTVHARDVTVHVRGDARARFQIKTSDGWTTLCAIPCTVRAPVDGIYRVASDVALDSQAVGLPNGDEVTVDAHLATFRERETGHDLMLLGGALLFGAGVSLVSAFFWAADLAVTNLCIHLFANDQCPNYDSSGPAILAVVGLGAAAAGGGLFGAGSVLHRPSRLVPARQDASADTQRYEGHHPHMLNFPIVTYRW